MDKKRREKRVTSPKDTDTTFDESMTIMDHQTSESEEKGLPNAGKMSENYLGSSDSSSDTIYDDGETILRRNKSEHFSKGKNKSGKIPPKFSEPPNLHGSSPDKGQRKHQKALWKHKATSSVTRGLVGADGSVFFAKISKFVIMKAL
jgi:hypothetical protein